MAVAPSGREGIAGAGARGDLKVRMAAHQGPDIVGVLRRVTSFQCERPGARRG